MPKRGLNYFSSTEAPFEERFAGWRDRFFSPVCAILANLGVSPAAVSVTGVLMLAGVWIFFISRPKLAVLFLALYILFDGIDGCVARKMKRASIAGGFVDILCDQTGMAVVTILLMAYNFISPVLGGFYIFAYTIMIAVTVARNALGAPPQWIFRTKYFLFLFYALWAFDFGRWFAIFYLIATPLTVLFAIMGSIGLYRRLQRVR